MTCGIFVSGTDTGVGKTVVAVALMRALVAGGFAALGMKPVAAGIATGETMNADVGALLAAANVVAPLADVNPFSFARPIAPHLAALAGGGRIDLERIVAAHANLAVVAEAVVIEGAGGLLVPLGDGFDMLDIPLRLSQPGDATKLPHVRMLPDPSGLSAITRVQVERRSSDYALVRCTLVTGRQHQIRAHLAASGFGIVGDKLYTHGDDTFIEYCATGLTPDLAKKLVVPRHALHAAMIAIPHPAGGTVTAEAPLPPGLAALVA